MGTLGDIEGGFECMGEGSRESLGCLKGLKPNLNSVEDVPGEGKGSLCHL